MLGTQALLRCPSPIHKVKRRKRFNKRDRSFTIGIQYRNACLHKQHLLHHRRGVHADGSMPKHQARQPTQPIHHSHIITSYASKATLNGPQHKICTDANLAAQPTKRSQAHDGQCEAPIDLGHDTTIPPLDVHLNPTMPNATCPSPQPIEKSCMMSNRYHTPRSIRLLYCCSLALGTL